MGLEHWQACLRNFRVPNAGCSGGCGISKGYLAGNLTVNYVEATGIATVTYGVDAANYYWQEIQFYVGVDIFPQKNGANTTAPGQYLVKQDPVTDSREK